MLFGNNKCDNCEHEYDYTLSHCPKCGANNNSRPEKIKDSKLWWLPPFRQGLLFLIGLGGLNIFEIILALVFSYFNKEPTKLMYNALVTYVGYGITFLCIFIVLFPLLKISKEHFSKIKPYLMGLLFGGGLIAFSILYGLLINKYYPTSTSDNEQIAQKLAIAYPLPSIIILCFIGPLVEEATYRFGLFNFVTRFNKIAAYIITCLVFGLIHFGFTSTDIIKELIYLPNYIIAGLILCFAYDFYGPSCSITAHIFNNLYSVIGVLIVNAIK